MCAQCPALRHRDARGLYTEAIQVLLLPLFWGWFGFKQHRKKPQSDSGLSLVLAGCKVAWIKCRRQHWCPKLVFWEAAPSASRPGGGSRVEEQGWRCPFGQQHPGEVSELMMRLQRSQHAGKVQPAPLPHT